MKKIFEIAITQLGAKEIINNINNPRIVEYHSASTVNLV